MSLGMCWCPTIQLLRDPEALKPCFHQHTLYRSLLLNSIDTSLTFCQPSWLDLSRRKPTLTLCGALCLQTSGDNQDQIKQSLQVKASVNALLPKGSQETLDPAQMSLSSCKGSVARTCSSLYPNPLFSKTAEDIPSAIISTCYNHLSCNSQQRGNSCSHSTPFLPMHAAILCQGKRWVSFSEAGRALPHLRSWNKRKILLMIQLPK